MEENTNVMENEVEFVDVTDDDGIEVYDLAPTSDSGSNGKVIAAVVGGIGLAVAGAIVGFKKLTKNGEEKKLEKAKKLLNEYGYDVVERDFEEAEEESQEPEQENEETSEEEKKEAPRRNKKRRR